MAAAAEGQGVAAESAAATAFGSIATIVATKSAAAPLDFTNTADIDAVVTQASTDLSASITAAVGAPLISQPLPTLLKVLVVLLKQ